MKILEILAEEKNEVFLKKKCELYNYKLQYLKDS